MRRFRVVMVALIAAVIASLTGVYSGFRQGSTRQQPSPAVPAAAVASLFANHLSDADGQPHSFSRWHDKTLVINFWATWCPPCREEMPAFSRLQDRYAAHGVQFVGIALDSVESVRAFAGISPVSYPLLIGGPEGVELAQQLGNPSLSLPYTLVFSPRRELRLARIGPLSEGELERLLPRAAPPGNRLE